MPNYHSTSEADLPAEIDLDALFDLEDLIAASEAAAHAAPLSTRSETVKNATAITPSRTQQTLLPPSLPPSSHQGHQIKGNTPSPHQTTITTQDTTTRSIRNLLEIFNANRRAQAEREGKNPNRLRLNINAAEIRRTIKRRRLPWSKLTGQEQATITEYAAEDASALRFSLNLHPAEEKRLLAVGRAGKDITRLVSDKLNRVLRKHGLASLPFLFTLETLVGAGTHRLHLHGVMIPEQGTPAYLGRLRDAFTRAAGKIPGREGATQFRLQEFRAGCGWFSYGSKEADLARDHLGVEKLDYTSQPMTRIARDFHDTARAQDKARRRKSVRGKSALTDKCLVLLNKILIETCVPFLFESKSAGNFAPSRKDTTSCTRQPKPTCPLLNTAPSSNAFFGCFARITRALSCASMPSRLFCEPISTWATSRSRATRSCRKAMASSVRPWPPWNRTPSPASMMLAA
jgi:hypothetical protein